jgi:hypothetical protein
MKFVNIDLPNVTLAPRRRELGWYDNKELWLQEELVPLIKMLAIKKPDWTFECQDYVNQTSPNAVIFTDVIVKERNRKAGHIDITHVYRRLRRVMRYRVIHDSIKKERGDQHTLTTSKVDQAFKLALKHFGAKTDAQVLDEKNNEITQAFRSVSGQNSVSGVVQKYIGSVAGNKLFSLMSTYIQNHEKDFMSMLPTDLHKTYTDYFQGFDKHKIVHTVTQQYEDKKTIMVFIDNDKWRIYNLHGTCDHETYNSDSDDIPEHVRRKVGMLKLVDNQHVIANVGYRMNETSFLITSADAPENE